MKTLCKEEFTSCEIVKENQQLKETLDSIREQLKLERKIALSLNKPYTISVIDRLFDGVKE